MKDKATSLSAPTFMNASNASTQTTKSASTVYAAVRKAIAPVEMPMDGRVSMPSAMSGAAKSAGRALELDPGLADAHLARGLILFHRDYNIEQSLAEFRTVLEIDPQNADAYEAINNVYAFEGKSAGAGNCK